MMSFPLEAASTRIGLGARPRLAAWLGRIHARPAYQAALQKGGPYAYAGGSDQAAVATPGLDVTGTS
jgi:glutathione S-transferase